jgi:tRNA threonylcarbamoyl adenosine modification protein YjeE
MTTSANGERLEGPAATLDLGRRLALALAPLTSGVLVLSGHLGAGKTTLVKGLAEGLGVAVAAEVTSPTFLRVVRYDGNPDLVHVDAYRMSGEEDVFELGLDEDLAGGALVAIEWPEMIEAALPADVLSVTLDHGGEDHRVVHVVASGEESRAWLERLVGGRT